MRMPRRRSVRLAPLGLTVAVLLLAALGAWHAVVRPWPPLTRLELAFDDLRQQALRPTGAFPGIVIVDIDDASLREIGRWPWSRDQVARLIDVLFDRYRVAALGLDIVFPEPEVAPGAALQSSLRATLAATEQALAASATAASGATALRQRLAELQHLLQAAAGADPDAALARALAHRPVALGYYFTGDPTADTPASRVGALPLPLFGAATLQGRPPHLPAWTGYRANLPALTQAAPQAGFFNFLPDEDGQVRSVPLVAALDGQVYESLSLALWRRALAGPQGRLPVVQPRLLPTPDRVGSVDLVGLTLATEGHGDAVAGNRLTSGVTLDERGQVRVPFRGSGHRRDGAFTYLAAADVLAGRVTLPALQGRIVLVGSSAPGVADLRPTPLNAAMPGVEVHAHLLAGLLSGDLPYRPGWTPGFEAALIALTLALAALATARLTAPRALMALAALAAALLGGNLAAYAAAGLVLPVASAAALGGALAVGLLGFRYLGEWQRRRSLQRLFGSYLPPQRVIEMARDPARFAVQAENRELTVLFCDLRGFSALAESLTPQALRELLNLFFSQASAVVHAHDGTLDKFIGDAVMAFWGAPLPEPAHAARAVRAAMALAEAAAPLNATLAANGLPAVRFGLGVATGIVCVGDLGSSLRRSYTAVGDAVNLAARLEALTRETGVDLLVADATRAACADSLADIVWAEVDEVQVRGRSHRVTLFTPLAAPPHQQAKLKQEVRLWQLALAAARHHHAGDAHALLDQLAAGAPGFDPAPLPPALQALCARLTRQLAGTASASPAP